MHTWEGTPSMQGRWHLPAAHIFFFPIASSSASAINLVIDLAYPFSPLAPKSVLHINYLVNLKISNKTTLFTK